MDSIWTARISIPFSHELERAKLTFGSGRVQRSEGAAGQRAEAAEVERQRHADSGAERAAGRALHLAVAAQIQHPQPPVRLAVLCHAQRILQVRLHRPSKVPSRFTFIQIARFLSRNDDALDNVSPPKKKIPFFQKTYCVYHSFHTNIKEALMYQRYDGAFRELDI